MIHRLFLYLIGFGLAVVGGVSLIAYLNVLTIGHSLLGYLLFISDKPECYLFFIGIFCLWLSVYWPSKPEK